MAQTKEGALKTAAKFAGISVEEFRARVSAGLKRCTACKNWKALDDFGIDTLRGDGKASTCLGCRRVKVRKCWKGRVSTFKGHRHTEETKAAISAALSGRPSEKKGVARTAATLAKMKAGWARSTKRGANHANYRHGAAQRALSDRRKPEYRVWRNAVFARDQYTCQKCGDAKGGNLRAHHIKSFAAYPELRYDIGNGLTLCHPCHELEHYKPDSTRNVRKLKRGEALWK